MKKLLPAFIFPLLLQAQAPYKKIRVLFLGNSYTYVNNLPLLIHDLALAKGDTLVYDSNCPGGYTFANHTADLQSLGKISAGDWDFVVLQAQSQEPSFPPGQVSTQTLPYATRLDTIIKMYNPCAHTVFYETWGRKYGDASNCAAYPPVCTYTGMQDRLRDSYRMFANTVHDLMAPVGEAFRLAIATNTAVDLYQADQSHPSLEGSYLAAAVFYETLFQKSVLSSTYNPGIPAATASLLNQAAHQLVTDSAYITNISPPPKATFTVVQQGPNKYFFQADVTGMNHQWLFSDGSSSYFSNTIHTFNGSGTFTITHTISNLWGCNIDSASIVLLVNNPVGLKEQVKEKLSLYPNPCKSYLKITTGKEFEKNASVQVYDITGQLLYCGIFNGYLDTSTLKQGLYYLRIYNNTGELRSGFIKDE